MSNSKARKAPLPTPLSQPELRLAGGATITATPTTPVQLHPIGVEPDPVPWHPVGTPVVIFG